MTRFTCFVLSMLVLLLGACAKRTRDVEPELLHGRPFIDATCSQLAGERAKRSQALIFSGLEQDQISQDDKVRTFGVPTPMGTVFDGDQEQRIARLKGELYELNAEMALKCSPDYR